MIDIQVVEALKEASSEDDRYEPFEEVEWIQLMRSLGFEDKLFDVFSKMIS